MEPNPNASELESALDAHETFFETVLTMPGDVERIDKKKSTSLMRFDNGARAVIKPRRFSGERLLSLNPSTFYLREAAAYQLDWQVLGWNLIPPTTISVVKHEPAAIQAFADGFEADELVPNVLDADAQNYGVLAARLCSQISVSKLRRLIIFDLLANNHRRLKNDVFFNATNANGDTLHTVKGINNSQCFGLLLRDYHNVFHENLFKSNLQITAAEKATLKRITLKNLRGSLNRYLSDLEIQHTYCRVQWVLRQENLGWDILSNNSGRMPSYRRFFNKMLPASKPSSALDDVLAMGHPKRKPLA